MTQEGMEIKLETLTDMLPFLQATQHPPPDLGTRSLIYDIGLWKGENLLAGIETFFQKNAYPSFATWMWKSGTHTHVHYSPQHSSGTTPSHP